MGARTVAMYRIELADTHDGTFDSTVRICWLSPVVAAQEPWKAPVDLGDCTPNRANRFDVLPLVGRS